jgi:hypothetical protein
LGSIDWLIRPTRVLRKEELDEKRNENGGGGMGKGEY